MARPALPRRQHREKVDAHFQAQSSYWRDIYTGKGVRAEIFRDRHAAVLRWIDELALAEGSRVLEIGCGAGLMAVDLCRRGFRVEAIDSSETMVELTRRYAAESQVTHLLSAAVGDVHSLAFGDASFDLVVAIGVLMWLERPELALQEMARVTRPRGHVLVTAAPRMMLTHLLDPWHYPVLRPLKLRVKDAIERVGLRRPLPNMTYHDCRSFDHAVSGVGLVKTRSMTVGFGPFTLLGRPILPERLGVAVHRRLQRLADRDVPVFGSTGASYHVLARKPMSASLERSTNAAEETGSAISSTLKASSRVR